MILFSRKNTAHVKFYNTCIRENWLYHVLPRFKVRNFRYHYGALRHVYAQMFPWQFVKEGRTVIQVSTAKSLIGAGVSHALMLSALVGPTGKVFVIEPDPSNVTVLKAYCIVQGINNVHVIQKAVWKERADMQFTVREDFSSWNRLTDTVSPKDMERQGLKSVTFPVQADTLDNIIRDEHIDNVSFVNMSINGSEYEAFQGMGDTLGKDVFLSFPIQNMRTFRSPILKELQDKGFTILVKHAPVATHQKQFLVAGAIKNPSSAILEQFNEEVELTETKKDGRDFILITSKNKNNAYDGWVFRKQIRWI
ncbi:MAG: hypothetical protein UX98_C0001G0080 [Parcubacteria group bacterium GW2011_GWA2_47_26]|nr:MAG: hypothetical protein UX98_C0001G0080 [Parcubacteria group bacterium GW2011_GWA2_47_26]